MLVCTKRSSARGQSAVASALVDRADQQVLDCGDALLQSFRRLRHQVGERRIGFDPVAHAQR
jgi:hypothetical protein